MTFEEWKSEVRHRNRMIFKGYQLFAEAVTESPVDVGKRRKQ